MHGRETRELRAERSAASARLSQLEDAARVLGMAEGPRIRGRKAVGYVPVRSVADVKQMVLEDVLNLDGGSTESVKIYSPKTYHP